MGAWVLINARWYYRARYSEFLDVDFPRLPLTANKTLFRTLCKLGNELIALHLMEKHGPVKTKFPVEGDDKVDKVKYTDPNAGQPGRVWINDTQYFEGVSSEVWEFHVGGYRVADKWLKDRKGRKLEFDDIQHYQRVIAALSETIRLMKKIDAAIDKAGGWPIR